jgi:hypothetical protein
MRAETNQLIIASLLKSAHQSIVSGGHKTDGHQLKDMSELTCMPLTPPVPRRLHVFALELDRLDKQMPNRQGAHLSGLAGISRRTFLNSDKTLTCQAWRTLAG